MLALNAAGLFFMYRVFRKKIQKSLELDSLVEDTRTEVGSFIAELNQTTERSVSLLEDKIAAAKEIIDLAERRIGLMKVELEKRNYERQVQERLSRVKPLVVERPTPEAATAPTTETAPEAEGLPRSARLRQGGPEETPPTQEILSPRSVPEKKEETSRAIIQPEIDFNEHQVTSPLNGTNKTEIMDEPLSERAYRLYQRGMSPEKIASRLGIAAGEIDLVLAMEEQRHRMDSTEPPTSR
jgi:hypothetical protein